MKHVTRITSSALALAGLVAAPSFAAQAQGHDTTGSNAKAAQDPNLGQDDRRLGLELGSAKSYAFRVEHRNANPLGAGGQTDTLTKKDEGGQAGKGGQSGSSQGQSGSSQGQSGSSQGQSGSQQDQPGSQPGQDAHGAQGGLEHGAAGMYEPDRELRFELRPQRASQQGQNLIQVDVSRSNALGAAGGEAGRPDPKAGQSDAGMGGEIASFQVLVDDQGRIVRMEKSGAGATAGGAGSGKESTGHAGGAADPSGAGNFGGLDENELRGDLAIILGSGLHGRALEKGQTYELGNGAAQPIEASAPRGDGIGATESFALRFESTREQPGAAGGNDPKGSGQPASSEEKGKVAAFTVLPRGDETKAGGAGHEVGGAGNEQGGADRTGEAAMAAGSIGQASYSLDDGLVVRFEARPAMGGKSMGESHAGAGDAHGSEHGAADAQGGREPHQPASKEGMHGGRWVTVERVAGR